MSKNLKCNIIGCIRLPSGKYCGTHYARFKRNGEFGPADGLYRKSMNLKLIQRSKVLENGCWEWSGFLGTREKNRGRIRFQNKEQYAHRVSYKVFIGPIEPGLLICHKCDNPLCINPSHLFKGTQKDNIQDCIKKNRFRRKNAKHNQK